MKRNILFIIASMVLLFFSACSTESEKTLSEKEILAKSEQIVNKLGTYIEQCQTTEPDYVVECNHASVRNTINGYNDIPVFYYSYDSADVHIEGYRYYTDENPISIQRISDDTIEIEIGYDVYRMADIEQNDSTLTFSMDAGGIEKCWFSIESSYFEHGNIMSLLNGQTKFLPPPFVYAVVEKVVIPFVVGVSASLIANSCTNNTQSIAEKCIDAHKQMSLDCQKRGGTPISQHKTKHENCFYTCVQTPAPAN